MMLSVAVSLLSGNLGAKLARDFLFNIWKALSKANKRCSELRTEALQTVARRRFCYDDMKKLFLVNGEAGPPHLVTGNKMRFEKAMDLLYFLFSWDDGEERAGWSHKPYRIILQKTFALIELRLGYLTAEQWLDRFFHLVRLTHWILPYPSNSAFLSTTKASRRQGLVRRTMWFSMVFAKPSLVQLLLQASPCTLSTILWRARRQAFEHGVAPHTWGSAQLITACQRHGLAVDEPREYWVAGKRSLGLKGFAAVWERGRPAQLQLLEQIRYKTLDELDELMVGFSQQHALADPEEDLAEPRERSRAARQAGPTMLTTDLGQRGRSDTLGSTEARTGTGRQGGQDRVQAAASLYPPRKSAYTTLDYNNLL
jgi:hypothetical protein